MKTVATFITVFVACFILGVGLTVTYPTSAQADQSDCNHDCCLNFCGEDSEQQCEPYDESMY